MTLSTQTQTAGSQKAIDAYLVALRKHLRELTDDDAKEIVEEIRMHLLDKTDSDGSVTETIAALGSPTELASQYCTEDMLARGRAQRSPAYIARSVGRWALVLLGGLVVFTLSAVGFGLGGWFVMLALLKIQAPGQTGVYGTWNEHEKTFHWQSGGPNAPGELLGWWLVPIGLIVGGVLLLLTFRFGNWSLRKLWPRRRLAES